MEAEERAAGEKMLEEKRKTRAAGKSREGFYVCQVRCVCKQSLEAGRGKTDASVCGSNLSGGEGATDQERKEQPGKGGGKTSRGKSNRTV